VSGPAFVSLKPVSGAKQLMDGLQQAYAADIKIREVDEKLSPDDIAVTVDEFSADGVVYDKNGVRVTAFEVNHGDVIKPAYGYRIDFRGKSVVISGDTRFTENVIKYGTGADLLIHEVGVASFEMMKLPPIQLIMAHHTSPQEAGTVFDRAKPKLAVYTTALGRSCRRKGSNERDRRLAAKLLDSRAHSAVWPCAMIFNRTKTRARCRRHVRDDAGSRHARRQR
jgi:hypothetical protein